MELGIIKNDVLNELRSKRYFNEQEITRLVQSDLYPHKERVKRIAKLTRKNVNLIEGVKLLEMYFPTQPQAATPAAQAPQQEITPTENV